MSRGEMTSLEHVRNAAELDANPGPVVPKPSIFTPLLN